MKRMSIGIALAAVALAGTLLALRSTEGAGPTASSEAVATGSAALEDAFTVEMTPLATESLSVGPGRLKVEQEGQPAAQIPVTLSKTTYQLTIAPKSGSPGSPWAGKIGCYELRSADPATQYAWAFWSTSPLLESFGLLSDDSGRGYLACVNQSAVILVEVGSQPRDKPTALADLFMGHERSRLAVFSVVATGLPRLAFLEGVAADTAYKVTVKAVARDADGTWRVKLTGTDPSKEFTVVGDGVTFRAE